MALTPEIRASQSSTQAVTSGASPEIRASQAYTTAVANFPTEEVRAASAQTKVVTAGATPDLRVSQGYVTVVARGRVEDRRLRAWTFSMDGHDFYVLQAGEEDTLVCDLTTGQWADWESANRNIWRAGNGGNWTGASTSILQGNDQNANIIAGDDTFGQIWFVSPALGYDQSPVDGTEVAFSRIVTGGIPMRQRQALRCNEVYLTASKGEFDIATASPTVQLRTSDDMENNWTDQGTITVVAEGWDQEFAWRSLGLIQAPGRVFEITDNCLARIDTLDMR